MPFDAIEKNALDFPSVNINDKLSAFNKSFVSSTSPENGVFINQDTNSIVENLREFTGIDDYEKLGSIKTSAFDTVKSMLNGEVVDSNGRKSLGLKDISNYKINEAYKSQNIKQQSGFAAEVISTAKENLISKADGSGRVTYRVDDLPDTVSENIRNKFAVKNDQYVDKIRINSDGTYETVQTKFVGKDAKECLSKLRSKNYDKYFNDGKMDKLEIPKDYYDEIKNQLIPDEKAKLQKQLDKMISSDKAEEATKIQDKIDKLDKIDNMIEQSTVTNNEAVLARTHPKLYALQITVKEANKEGLKSAKQAALFTVAVSTARNFMDYSNDKISAKEMVTNIGKETFAASTIAYVSGAVSSITGSSIPATAISFGVTSFNDIKAFKNHEIDGSELAYNLGKNAFGIIGGAAGGALGSVLGVPGSLVGSMEGYAVATKAYEKSVDFVKDHVDDVSDLAVDIKNATVEKVSDVKDIVIDKAKDVADIADNVKDAAVEKLGDVKDFVADKASGTIDMANYAKNAAVDKLSDVKSGAVKTFSSAKGKIVGFVKK